jgi:hypothetical protein
MININVIKNRFKIILDDGDSISLNTKQGYLPFVLNYLHELYNGYFLNERDNIMGIGDIIMLGRALDEDRELGESAFGKRLDILIDDLYQLDQIQQLKFSIINCKVLIIEKEKICNKIDTLLEAFSPDASLDKQKYRSLIDEIKKIVIKDEILMDDLPKRLSLNIRRFW